MKALMEWIRDHMLPHRQAHPTAALRDASHRLNNETMALRNEVARSVGGPQNLELLIRRMKEDRDNA